MPIPATYRNLHTGQYATETQLRAGGVNTESREVMNTLGWTKIEYPYPNYNKWTQEILPDGEPTLVADGSGYIQNFKVVPLNAERLEASLARYKYEALERLNAEWIKAEQDGRLQSAVGFPIDATVRADRDIRGLITKLEATGEEQTLFCDADNNMQPVNLEKLKIMQLEVIQYGQTLYARKWNKREAIMAAANFEEVDAVSLSFMDAA